MLCFFFSSVSFMVFPQIFALVLSAHAANPANFDVNPDSETKPLLCNGSVESEACLFTGEFCSFKSDFGKNLSATRWDDYNGDVSSQFVIEAGNPEVKDGVLVVPLIQTAIPQAAATIMFV
jgi:hypothetical protein